MSNNQTLTTTKLWIGGTSGLTRTYFNAFVIPTLPQTNAAAPDNAGDWCVLGLESTKPTWLPAETTFRSCDLTKLQSVQHAKEFWTRYSGKNNVAVQQIVISVRPPLVTAFRQSLNEHTNRMLAGLEYLLAAVLLGDDDSRPEHHHNNTNLPLPQRIVHISSIAAVDHIRRQCLWSEIDPDPVSDDLVQPYDRFKRASEELVQRLVAQKQQQQQPDTPIIEYTNLRLGAIFSDTETCIQCSALALQARVGPYMKLAIDCNSARNASSLIHTILQRQQSPTKQQHPPVLRPVYYYTRPLQYRDPLPYGEYLVAYRRAHDMHFVVWVPSFLVRGFVSIVHLIAWLWGNWIPYLQSLDYLLQVTKDEHSFAAQAVQEDFPNLASQEETIEACFRRRQHQLRLDVNVTANKKDI